MVLASELDDGVVSAFVNADGEPLAPQAPSIIESAVSPAAEIDAKRPTARVRGSRMPGGCDRTR
jgi:hypothetical protein